jgi:hypothetical protein
MNDRSVSTQPVLSAVGRRLTARLSRSLRGRVNGRSCPIAVFRHRKLVFRSIPVTQVTETLHHLPATTSLIAAASWLPA